MEREKWKRKKNTVGRWKRRKKKKSLTLHPSFPIVLALLSIKIEKLAWALYGPFSQRLAKKQKNILDSKIGLSEDRSCSR